MSNVSARVELTASGLWVPTSFSFNRFRPQVKTVTLRNGERAKVTVEPTSRDNSAVIHIERNEGIDAVIRPKVVKYKLRSML